MQVWEWVVAMMGVSQILDESVIDDGANKTKIAIIGAGIAASAVVSRLLQDDASVPADITVFEKESFVGGRVKSLIHEFGEFGAIEEGAAYFSTDDRCMLDLVERAGLKHGAQYPKVGLINGHVWPIKNWEPPFGLAEAFCDLETTDWFRMQEHISSHGSSFWSMRNLLERVRSSWDFFLSWEERDIGRAMHNANLSYEARTTAQKYIDQYALDTLQDDVLTPCARARSYKHISELSALSCLLSARSITNTGVLGGNIQIIQRILEHVNVQLTTAIDRIRAGTNRAIALQYGGKTTEFDYVIITAPLGTSNLIVELADVDIFTSSYEERHVTLVVTDEIEMRLKDHDYLDVQEMSDNVLTSGTKGGEVDAVVYKVKCGKHRCAQRDELDSSDDDAGWKWKSVYRIISRTFMNDEEISKLISSSPTLIHRRNWTYGLPIWQENEAPESAELAPGLFYTASLEHVVSSMEMSCRMGRHVAEHVTERMKAIEMEKRIKKYRLSHSFEL